MLGAGDPGSFQVDALAQPVVAVAEVSSASRPPLCLRCLSAAPAGEAAPNICSMFTQPQAASKIAMTAEAKSAVTGMTHMV